MKDDNARVGQIIVSVALLAFMVMWYFFQKERALIDYVIATGMLTFLWAGPWIGNKISDKVQAWRARK